MVRVWKVSWFPIAAIRALSFVLWIILPFFFFFMKGGTHFQLSNFISLFPPVEFWGSDSFLSFCPLCPFSPSWQGFYRYNILKNLVGFPCMSQGFTPFNKRLLCRSFPRNLISLTGFCPNGQRDQQVTWLIPWKSSLCDCFLWPFVPSKALAKHCSATPLVFSPKYALPTVCLLMSALFAIWIGWEFRKSRGPGSFLLNSAAPDVSLSSQILL